MNDEDYKPEYLPPPIHTTELVLSDAWLEACAKYGHHPLEFATYGYITLEQRRQAQQDEQEEQAHYAWIMEERRLEYEMEATRLAAILAYDPKRFAKLLIPEIDTECKEWCCNDFAA